MPPERLSRRTCVDPEEQELSSADRLKENLVDLLNSHKTHNGALMTFQRLKCNLFYLVQSLAKEELRGCCQHILILSLNFHLKYNFFKLTTN